MPVSDNYVASSPTEFFRPHAEKIAIALVTLIAPLVAFPWQEIRFGLLDGKEDAIKSLPDLVHSARMLVSGQLLWTPDLWMGHPLLADPSFAVLYPPRLLLLAGPPVSAYALYVLGHFVMAELTAYAYLKAIGLGRLGALFGALGYAYAGFMLGHRGDPTVVAAGAWAPLVLLLFELAATRGGRITQVLAAVAFAMLPFAGALQLSVYLTCTLLVLGAVRAFFERRWSRFTATLLTLAPGTLVGALQALPALHYFYQVAGETEPAHDASFALSFHPLLLPSLYLPNNLTHAEFYSRAGVLIVCAAFVAATSWRTASPIVRAWTVVAVLALALRHNFELGLALSVLAGFGFEQVRAAGSPGLRGRWLVAGLVLCALTALAVWLGGSLTGDVGGTPLTALGWPTALGTGLFFALWLRALGGPAVPPVVWLAIAVGPLLETAWAARNPASHTRDFRALPATAGSALPATRPVRVLSVPALRGSVDTLVGSSALFHQGVQALQGFSASVHPEMTEILHLSAQGQPRAHADLAWSLLPSLYGVTHLVLPAIECGSPELELGPDERCTSGRAEQPSSPPVRLECKAIVKGLGYRARVEAQVRASSKNTPGIAFGFLDHDARSAASSKLFELFVPGNALAPEFTGHSKSLALAPINPIVNFSVSNEGHVPIAFRHVRFIAERDRTISELVSSESTLVHAELTGETLTLLPALAEAAKAERRIYWPRAEGRETALLELEARALGAAASGQLVVDLYNDRGFDPESAQLVVLAKDLRQEFTLVAKPITVFELPEDVSLRVFAEGGVKAEVRRARLLARSEQLLSGYPVTRGPLQEKLRIDGAVAELGPHGWVSGRLYMPVRPLEIRLWAAPTSPAKAGVEFGLHAAGMPLDDFQRRRVDADELAGPWPLKKTALVAPDASEGSLFVRANDAPALRVKRLSLRDACAVRQYRNPKPLAYGLMLYENPRALPRAYTADQVVVVEDLKSVRRTLLAFDESALGSKVVIDAPVSTKLSRGEVESAAFGVTSSEILVKSDHGPTLLVTNERYAPEWIASIDGNRTPILRANGIVRAVVVPQGRHRVRFDYVVPSAVWWGAASAIAGLLLALFVVPVVLTRLGRALSSGE